MRALKRLRSLEIFAGVTEGAYAVDYEYDVQGHIITETLTGAIERNTAYTYDVDDNIETETTVEGGRTTTKTYTYDPATKNVTRVTVSVA